MSNITAPAHRSVANIRSPSGTGPQTPLRSIPSSFGSPSALRAEEDCIVLELGSRFLRAGFAGSSTPQAVVDFGREEQRRPGDYRRWAVGYDSSKWSRVQENGWGADTELWRADLRGFDLGLVGDKIERAVREAYTKYLLIDSRPRRVVLCLPSTFALPLLSTVLDSLFTNFQPPTISLLAAPVLATVAAGLRSALVVDIGWAGTVVTGIYEYREVGCTRSIRGSKLLGETTSKLLSDAINSSGMAGTIPEDTSQSYPDFEECEEIVERMVWCRSGRRPEALVSPPIGLTPVREEDEFRASMRSLNIREDLNADPAIPIPLISTNPPTMLHIPFSELAEPCERALFASGIAERDFDDEELPLHLLVYRSLLRLPVDVRSICMARIVFVGGASNIPGLKSRVLDEVATLIEQRGWSLVRGRAVEQYRRNPKLQRAQLRKNGPTEVVPVNGNSLVSSSQVKQEHDPIAEKIKREASKELPPIEAGNLRAINSLGAWSGGSLLSQLKIPAVSVVEREKWLQDGLAGATKAGEISVATSNRQSMGPGLRAGDRSSWTLGLWG